MQLSARRYAEAYLDAVEGSGPDALPELTKRFVRLVERRHQRKLLPRILKEVEGEWYERHGLHPVRLRSARKLDQDFLTTLFGSETPVTASVEPDLIAGVIVERKDERIDASFKSALRRLQGELSRKD